MRGRMPMRPLEEIADAAVGVFLARGFRPAGISDVAAALGLSHGAVYTYAKSKQALLHLALMRVLRPDAVAGLAVPVQTPTAEEVIAVVESWAGDQTALPLLARASAGPAGASGLSPEAELGGVVDELYAFVEQNRTALQLVERCAEQLPELAQWYFVQRRRAMVEQVGTYLAARIAAGLLRPVPDVPVAARFIVETVAWFAMHRHGDPDSRMLADDDCRRTVHHLLVAAFPSTEDSHD
ncbi:TetR/AcrR family transcriptional regulator [Kitasatospora acidiphila]|uniref:TetR/AcrR family transcriptional regulator n=1 Tax=Kitasatospora acidiphila TaxID=2567942 RepID=A0A540W5J7_9ACTN|nr:TetR family transcriptional regulator [Kitasatospora acidiphila]TQF03624.1 TetR/AcrR family transcriptional regulator [Kitasatospora acidiphila]